MKSPQLTHLIVLSLAVTLAAGCKPKPPGVTNLHGGGQTGSGGDVSFEGEALERRGAIGNQQPSQENKRQAYAHLDSRAYRDTAKIGEPRTR